MSSQPTESIRVSLALFEGPLDLLLHLIQEQRIDITVVSISQITARYLEMLHIMREMDLDIAGDYLVMAATLVFIKSRYLLPAHASSESDSDHGDDIREQLIDRLRHYQLFREAGDFLGRMSDQRCRFVSREPPIDETSIQTEWIYHASVVDLLRALKNVIHRQQSTPVHLITPNRISVREKMSELMRLLTESKIVMANKLFDQCVTRQEAIVVFLAILELMRMQVIRARQKTQFGDIRISLLSL